MKFIRHPSFSKHWFPFFLLVAFWAATPDVEATDPTSNHLRHGSDLDSDAKNDETFRTRDLKQGKPIDGNFIIEFEQDVADPKGLMDEIVKGCGGVKLYEYDAAIQGFAISKLSSGCAKKLLTKKGVKSVEQDMVVTVAAATRSVVTVATCKTPEITPWGITRVTNSISNYTGTNRVWVLDTGIDLTHPDLNVDATNGFSAFSIGVDKTFNDDHGHGTHVAGTIAAKSNGCGVVGVAPGAPVVPVKVLNRNGSGSLSGIIAGINHVASKGKSGDVANMSLGGGISSTLDSAVKNAAAKSIYFALAAGNEAKSATLVSPARANGANIYTISAMDVNDNFALSFSNYGNPPVDYCAPGVNITSTYKGGAYAIGSGTSMAAPHACGVLLVTQGNPKSGGTVKNDPDGTADYIIHT